MNLRNTLAVASWLRCSRAGPFDFVGCWKSRGQKRGGAAAGWLSEEMAEPEEPVRESGWLCFEMFPGRHHWRRHRAPSRDLWEESSWRCPRGSCQSVGPGAAMQGMWSSASSAEWEEQWPRTKPWRQEWERGGGERPEMQGDAQEHEGHFCPHSAKGCSLSSTWEESLVSSDLCWKVSNGVGKRKSPVIVTSRVTMQQWFREEMEQLSTDEMRKQSLVPPWRRRQRANLTWEVSGMEEVLAPVNAEGEERKVRERRWEGDWQRGWGREGGGRVSGPRPLVSADRGVLHPSVGFWSENSNKIVTQLGTVLLFFLSL